jgi:hypothetical protein
MAKKQPFSEQLRRAVLDCGESRYRLSLELGVSESLLSRFVNGDIGLSLANIDKICERIGGRLVVDASRTKRKDK